MYQEAGGIRELTNVVGHALRAQEHGRLDERELGDLTRLLAKVFRAPVVEEPRIRHRSLRVFGPFRVIVDGSDVPLPGSRPVELLKILALRGGSIHVETVIDALWPDSDTATGRRRIKNVINRARRIIGSDALVRQGDLLILHGSVSLDVSEYRTYVSAATSAPAGSELFVEAATAALNLARQGLLPNDRFADWAADDRWHIESTAGRLLEELAASGDVGPPTDWLVDVATDLEILDESLFLALARRAMATSAEASARRAVKAAARVAEKLAVRFQPPPDLIALARG